MSELLSFVTNLNGFFYFNVENWCLKKSLLILKCYFIFCCPIGCAANVFKDFNPLEKWLLVTLLINHINCLQN